MSEQLPVTLTFEQAHWTAISEVNCWRGHCMELNARLDRAVTSALLAWHCEAIPQTWGDRLQLLRKLTGEEGKRSDPKLHDLATALSNLRDEWRDRMAHATSTVHLDANNQWVWHFSLPKQPGRPEDRGSLGQADGSRIERELKDKVNTLRGRLKHFGVACC